MVIVTIKKSNWDEFMIILNSMYMQSIFWVIKYSLYIWKESNYRSWSNWPKHATVTFKRMSKTRELRKCHNTEKKICIIFGKIYNSTSLMMLCSFKTRRNLCSSNRVQSFVGPLFCYKCKLTYLTIFNALPFVWSQYNSQDDAIFFLC